MGPQGAHLQDSGGASKTNMAKASESDADTDDKVELWQALFAIIGVLECAVSSTGGSPNPWYNYGNGAWVAPTLSPPQTLPCAPVASLREVGGDDKAASALATSAAEVRLDDMAAEAAAKNVDDTGHGPERGETHRAKKQKSYIACGECGRWLLNSD